MKAKNIALALLMFMGACKDKTNPEPQPCSFEKDLIGIGLDKNPSIVYLETEEHRILKLDLNAPNGGNAVLTLEDHPVDDIVRLEFKDTAGCVTNLSGKAPGAGVNSANPTVRELKVSQTDITADNNPAAKNLTTLFPLDESGKRIGNIAQGNQTNALQVLINR